MVIDGPLTPLSTTLGTVTTVEEFKYLGTTIRCDGTLSTHWAQRQTQGQRAKYRFHSFRRDPPAMSPSNLMEVFESLCTPTFMFVSHLERLTNSRAQVNHLQQNQSFDLRIRF